MTLGVGGHEKQSSSIRKNQKKKKKKNPPPPPPKKKKKKKKKTPAPTPPIKKKKKKKKPATVNGLSFDCEIDGNEMRTTLFIVYDILGHFISSTAYKVKSYKEMDNPLDFGIPE